MLIGIAEEPVHQSGHTTIIHELVSVQLKEED